MHIANFNSLFVLGLLVQALWSVTTAADTLVETEPGQCGGSVLSEDQFLAIAVPVSEDYILDSIETTIGYVITTGIVDVVLYADVDGKPGTHLRSERFEVTGRDRGWYGITNLQWPVSRGRHWIAFEVHDSSFESTIDGPDEVSLESSFFYHENNEWIVNDGRQCLGLRIKGEPAAGAAK